MEKSLTVVEFLNCIKEIFDENKDIFLKAQIDPQLINYLVGKVMVKTKGIADTKVTLNTIKAIVESDLPNTIKINF